MAGTYSYRPLVCDEAGLGPWTLAQPVCDKDGIIKIMFAGEATHTTRWHDAGGDYIYMFYDNDNVQYVRYGTVDGAMSSGEREAERLISFLKS